MSNTVQQTNPRTSARGDLDLTFDVDYPQQLSRWKRHSAWFLRCRSLPWSQFLSAPTDLRD